MKPSFFSLAQFLSISICCMAIEGFSNQSESSLSVKASITYPIRLTDFILNIELDDTPLPEKETNQFMEAIESSLYDGHQSSEAVDRARFKQFDSKPGLCFRMQPGYGNLTYAIVRLGVGGLVDFLTEQREYRSLRADLKLGEDGTLLAVMSIRRMSRVDELNALINASTAEVL